MIGRLLSARSPGRELLRRGDRNPTTAARRRALGACTAAALSLLAGCASFTNFGNKPASRLYALDVSTAPAPRAACGVRFAIRELRLAAHLERPEVVLAREGSRIVAEPSDLWAGPLAQQLRRELSRALVARLEGSQAAPHPWRLDETPQLALALDVDRLEAAGGTLHASVGWRVVEVAGNRQLVSERWESRRPLASGQPTVNGANAQSVVQAIDAALAELADTLATRITADPNMSSRWCGAR